MNLTQRLNERLLTVVPALPGVWITILFVGVPFYWLFQYLSKAPCPS